MPETKTALAVLRATAFKALGEHLVSTYNAAQLTKDEVAAFAGRKFEAGWRFEADGGQPLRLFAGAGFPYEPPRIALSDKDKVLVWPHVERDGVLCIYSEETSIDLRQPARVADTYIAEALALIHRSKSGKNADDLKDEFLSYWAIAADSGAPMFRSIVKPEGPTRKIRVWRGSKNQRQFRIFGDEEATLTRWLARGNGNPGKDGYNITESLLIWRNEPLAPQKYPSNAHDLLELLDENGNRELAASILFDTSGTLDLLIGAQTKDGACFAGLSFPRFDKKQAEKGFRSGKVPKSRFYQIGGSPARTAQKVIVERADPSWVHGRDQDDEQHHLSQKCVAVIGCGALGASIAVQLAQSGVGSFHFIDGQRLGRENTSRHPLGATYAGQMKATALKDFLEMQLPHLQQIEAVPKDLVCTDDKLLTDIFTADLILATTGEWGSMSLLADAARTKKCLLQTAWLEPMAMAAHSVVTSGMSACLRCGFTDHGVPLSPATLWPDESHWKHAPGCAGTFAPYGATDLAVAAGIVGGASLRAILSEPVKAVHDMWLAPFNRIMENGGELNVNWLNGVGIDLNGGVSWSGEWQSRTGCPLCG